MTTAAPAARYHTRLAYTDRVSKARYIADKYAPILTASVLDIGCDRRLLRDHLPAAVRYVGVDASPGADVVLNLDRDELPFQDASFDTVIAADVLEHLERLHAVFDRLCAIARRHVVIALPNPLRNLVLELSRGSKGPLKYYGLPVEEPRDRHRWFFGFEEAAEFLRLRGQRNGMTIEQIDASERGCPVLKDASGRNVVETPNAQLGTLWCVLARAAVE